MYAASAVNASNPRLKSIGWRTLEIDATNHSLVEVRRAFGLAHLDFRG
jgi:hypothetical protein